MSYFDVILPARFTPEQLKSLNQIVNTNQDIYMTRSHFVRIAVLKLLREHGVKDDKENLI